EFRRVLFRSSRSATGPPSAASPTRTCSVETYSSPISVANFWAWVNDFTAYVSNCGDETVAPVAEGRVEMTDSSSLRTAPGSAPAAVSSGAANPSLWDSNAPSRCAGEISGLPAMVAACAADEIACCVFVVGLKASIPHLPPYAKTLFDMDNARKVERGRLNLSGAGAVGSTDAAIARYIRPPLNSLPAPPPPLTPHDPHGPVRTHPYDTVRSPSARSAGGERSAPRGRPRFGGETTARDSKPERTTATGRTAGHGVRPTIPAPSSGPPRDPSRATADPQVASPLPRRSRSIVLTTVRNSFTTREPRCCVAVRATWRAPCIRHGQGANTVRRPDGRHEDQPHSSARPTPCNATGRHRLGGAHREQLAPRPPLPRRDHAAVLPAAVHTRPVRPGFLPGDPAGGERACGPSADTRIATG